MHKLSFQKVKANACSLLLVTNNITPPHPLITVPPCKISQKRIEVPPLKIEINIIEQLNYNQI